MLSEETQQLYSSNNDSIVKRQLALMKRAGLDFAISSWCGRGDYAGGAAGVLFYPRAHNQKFRLERARLGAFEQLSKRRGLGR